MLHSENAEGFEGSGVDGDLNLLRAYHDVCFGVAREARGAVRVHTCIYGRTPPDATVFPGKTCS